MLPISYFDRFAGVIGRLALKGEDEKYQRTELVCPEFRLFTEGNLEVYYAPFHFFRAGARLILVGLTPGWTQMEEAFRAARRGGSLGLTGSDLFEYIDRVGSFSGPLRGNLVSMLDEIGLANSIGIESSGHLFGHNSTYVSFTSAVSAPIFRQGDNYRGYGPPLLKVGKLRQWIIENLGTELASAPNALVIPLGSCADAAIAFLQAEGVLSLRGRCLTGFPHPSGANGHRKSAFARGRSCWKRQIAAWFSGQEI